jgi:hypothetical protein
VGLGAGGDVAPPLGGTTRLLERSHTVQPAQAVQMDHRTRTYRMAAVTEKCCDILSAQSAGWKHFAFYLDRYQPGDWLCHTVWRSGYRSRTAAFDVYNFNYQ